MNYKDSTETAIASHQGRLDKLVGMESRIGDLREREVELEVDAIAAETLLDPGAEGVSGADAGSVVELINLEDRRRRLDEALGQLDTVVSNSTELWRSGAGELRNWLDAPGRTEGTSVGVGVRTALAIVSLAALAAGFFVHLALLLLLIPIGATSALLWSGNDASWRRAGSRKRFEATGLVAPRSWVEIDVSVRLNELEAALESRASALEGATSDDGVSSMDRGTLLHELDANEHQREALQRSTGIDLQSLPPAELKRLRGLAEVNNARQQLQTVRSKRADLEAEAEAIRSEIYLFVQRHRAGGAGGRADTTTLRAALATLETGARGK